MVDIALRYTDPLLEPDHGAIDLLDLRHERFLALG
jgi:hypothetical protein